MFDLEFQVDMVPTGKGRPRLGRGRVFTPKKTMDAEKVVASAAREAMAGRAPTAVPLMMFIEAVFPVPVSYTRKRRQDIALGYITPGKPDGDNIAKLVADSLNQLVYEDDAQLCLILIQKRYGDQPQLWVKVTQHDGAVPSIRSALPEPSSPAGP